MALDEFKMRRVAARSRANVIRHRKFRRPVHRFYRAHREIRPWYRLRNADYWHGKVLRARALTLHRLYVRATVWAMGSGPSCVTVHEGGVTSNTGNGYYGRWQADTVFQLAYGPEFYRRWGVASNWPRWAQDVMAYRGWLARGWTPWPNTARACGLL